MNEKMLKLAVGTGYDEYGVRGLFKECLKSQTKARKEIIEALEEKGEEYNETSFRFGYISSKLELARTITQYKPFYKDTKGKLELADILRTIADEIEDL